MDIKVEYKGREESGDVAKKIEDTLVNKSKKWWKPCCLLEKEVGKMEWEVAPKAGRGYKIHECPVCKRVSFELIWIS